MMKYYCVSLTQLSAVILVSSSNWTYNSSDVSVFPILDIPPSIAGQAGLGIATVYSYSTW